jgi:toxin ParE1/3/4
MQLEISPEGIDDLAEILSYSVAEFGEVTAYEYMRGFYDAFDRLTANPRIGPVFEGTSEPVRSLSHRSHRIFYALTRETILIIRIIHKSRDAANLLH